MVVDYLFFEIKMTKYKYSRKFLAHLVRNWTPHYGLDQLADDILAKVEPNKEHEEWCKHNLNINGIYERCYVCNPTPPEPTPTRPCPHGSFKRCKQCEFDGVDKYSEPKKKIEPIDQYDVDTSMFDMANKVNEVIEVINSMKK